MLRAIIVGPERSVVQRVSSSLERTGAFEVVRTLHGYPEKTTLEITLSVRTPEVLFLGVDSLEEALAVRQQAEAILPGLVTVAFRATRDEATLLRLMQAGIREFLAETDDDTLLRLADRVGQLLEANPPAISSLGRIAAFLPAKPGAGATTVATNVSAFVARRSPHKVLLADLDLSNGVAAFLLGLDNRYSIMDALEHCSCLDENLWPSLVSRLERLDVLASPKLTRQQTIPLEWITELFRVTRRLYGLVCVDLSGYLGVMEIEAVKESSRIVLVCTPEVPVLHLARQKLTLFAEMQLTDRVDVVVNRWHRQNAMSLHQLEEAIGQPVYQILPNDYASIRAAQDRGSAVDWSSALGQGLTELARRAFGAEPLEPRGWDRVKRMGNWLKAWHVHKTSWSKRSGTRDRKNSSQALAPPEPTVSGADFGKQELISGMPVKAPLDL